MEGELEIELAVPVAEGVSGEGASAPTSSREVGT